MTSPTRTSGKSTVSARSLQGTSLVAILAAFTHAHEFGPVAYVAGAVIVAVLWSLVAAYRRTDSKAAVIAYGLVSAWVIVGLGLVGGFWNHAVKVLVVTMHHGAVPAVMEPLFMSPATGPAAYEAVGVLTFVASVLAARYGYRFAREVAAR